MGRPNWLKNLLGRRSQRRQISNSNEDSNENSKIEMTIPSGKGMSLSSSHISHRFIYRFFNVQFRIVTFVSKIGL